MGSKIKLSDPVIKTFKAVKYFSENSDRLNSFSFSNNGEFLMTSSNDDQMVIFDCYNGCPKRTLNSKKYGVNLINFTHSNTTAIHSSTKIDDTIRYLSLHDNKYIRYFQGHSQRVISLSMSPLDDTFISGSLDQTLKLWDLRSQNCHGVLNVSGTPCAAFDPEGLIFAAGINSRFVKLYDLRSFDKGPFTTFTLNEKNNSDWKNLKFSPDGRYILISTDKIGLYLIDAFNGNLIHSFPLLLGSGEDQSWSACFSPDSQYVLVGSAEGVIHVWNTSNGMRVCDLIGFEAASDQANKAMQCISFNPKFCMLATGSHQTSFWLPFIDDLNE